MKNKRYGAVFVACAAIILAGCAPDPSTSDTSTSSSQESSLPSSIGSEGSDSSSMSAGGTSTASEPESSTPGTSVYVDPMMLFDEALKKDYSNQTLLYDANVDGSDIALLYVYSFDGYQAVYDYNMALSGYDYEDCFLFYHDYEGESRLFFEDEGHGDAWLAYGYHDAPLGIENTYFNTPEFLDVVKTLKHEDITYAPMGLPIYYVLDEEKVAETAGEFFGFFGFELSNVAYYGFTINDDGYIEVEILHDGLEKEVVFNGRNEWIRTEWEIHRNQLPTEVIEVIEKAGYSSRHIDDDIDVIETDAGLKYEVEIEDGHTDIKLIITNGTITDILRD